MKDGTRVGECGFRLSLCHMSPSYNYSSPMLAGVEAGDTVHMVVVSGTVPSSPGWGELIEKEEQRDIEKAREKVKRIQGMKQEEPFSPCIGATVMLRELSKPELNGQAGVIIAWHSDRHRWEVRLSGQSNTVAVKSDKLCSAETHILHEEEKEEAPENKRHANPNCAAGTSGVQGLFMNRAALKTPRNRGAGAR